MSIKTFTEKGNRDTFSKSICKVSKRERYHGIPKNLNVNILPRVKKVRAQQKYLKSMALT